MSADSLLLSTSWVEHVDASTGKPYFYNKETKETTWKVPAEYASWKAQNEAIERFLQTTSWRKAKNKDGKVYFYNKSTNVTQWSVPDVLATFLTAPEKSDEGVSKAEQDDSMLFEDEAGDGRGDEEEGEGDGDFGEDDDGSRHDEEDDRLFGPEEEEGEEERHGEMDEVSGDDDIERTPNHLYDDEDDLFGEGVDGQDGGRDEDDVGTYGVDYEKELGDSFDKNGSSYSSPKQEPLSAAAGSHDEPQRKRPRQEQEHGQGQGQGQGQGRDRVSEEKEIRSEEERRAAELRRLEASLSARDSILEPDIIATAKAYFQLSQDGPRITRLLAEGYAGYAQMVGMMADWLYLAKSLEKGSSEATLAAPSSSSTSISTSTLASRTNTSEAVVVDLVASFVKRKFDKDLADQLLRRATKPAWLAEMVNDPTYRRLLIDLYDQHSGSSLLGLCLREISAKGFHQEIAHVIHESDYFEVFNDLLVDMLSRVSSSNAAELLTLASDLKRSCCSAEYMFIFAAKLFAEVEAKVLLEIAEERQKLQMASPQLISKGDQNRSAHTSFRLEFFTGIRCKVRRLRQELESAAVWRRQDRADGTDALAGFWGGLGGNGGMEIGRLDPVAAFALRLSGSFVPPPAPRTAPGAGAGAGSGTAGGSAMGATMSTSAGSALTLGNIHNITSELADIVKTGEVTAVHVQRLCMHYFKLTPKDNIDQLATSADHLRSLATPIQGVLPLSYLRHAMVLRLLVDAFIHPSRGLPNASARIAKLLSLACGFDDASAVDVEGDHCDLSAHLAVTTELELNLNAARSICIDTIKMLHSVVAYDKPTQLLPLMKSPCVSMCVLRWIAVSMKEPSLLSKQDEFLTSMPIFLQLLVQAVQLHPLQRPDCFEILTAILCLSSMDVGDDEGKESSLSGGHKEREGYTLISAQKDALECLVFLMGTGYTMLPMNFLTARSSSFDAVMVRHAVHLLCHSIKPPFSRPFTLKMVDLLSAPSVKQAILGPHFMKQDAALLIEFASAVKDQLQVADPVRLQALEAVVGALRL